MNKLGTTFIKELLLNIQLSHFNDAQIKAINLPEEKNLKGPVNC